MPNRNQSENLSQEDRAKGGRNSQKGQEASRDSKSSRS